VIPPLSKGDGAIRVHESSTTSDEDVLGRVALEWHAFHDLALEDIEEIGGGSRTQLWGKTQREVCPFFVLQFDFRCGGRRTDLRSHLPEPHHWATQSANLW
jgi:hypothetical protein